MSLAASPTAPPIAPPAADAAAHRWPLATLVSPPEGYPLPHRGFRWVSEFPYQR